MRRSPRKHYQCACEILLEIQRDMEPSAPRRAEGRIPKCVKYELPDGYRLVLQRGDSDGVMVALSVGTHDHVSSFLDGHKGYVFDERTGQLRELRVGTASETAVEMVPSAALLAGQRAPEETRAPLFDGFSDDMLRTLGVPDEDFPAVRRLVDPNDFDCMTMLQPLAETAPKAADALLAFATGNPETRQSVLDLASGVARFAEQFPEAAVQDGLGRSKEFLTIEDSNALHEVLDRGTLQQWQLGQRQGAGRARAFARTSLCVPKT